MKSFFTSGTWPRRRGRLHVYAFANPPVAAMADAYHQVLADPSLTGLSRQPDRFLHVTIEQIQRYTDEVSDDQLSDLCAALAKQVAAVPTFDLIVGPALVGTRAIGLDAVPDELWQRLRQAVRAAATEALGGDAIKPMYGPGAPHITISYATADADIEPHLRALHNVRPGRVTLPVTEVHLVAVEQNPEEGVYSWPGTVATFALATDRNRRGSPAQESPTLNRGRP